MIVSNRYAGSVLALALVGGAACAQQSPCADPGSLGGASPFGIAPSYVNARRSTDLARWVPEMKSIGVSTTRSANAYWHELEVRPGQWDWRALDDQVGYLVRQNMAFGVLLLGNPAWNTRDAQGTLPVNNLDGWTRYVTQVTTRLRGKVRCVEVWNEPPNNTGNTQTPADYARLVQATYQAVKAVDPRMRVGLAAKSAHVNYLELVIRAGARNAFDYITLHPYEVLGQVAASASPSAEAVYSNIVPSVRRMLLSANPERKDVPVVFSELGISAAAGLPVQASGLVKAYVLGIAQGVSSIQWFEGRDGDSGPLGLIDAAGNKRPAHGALGRLIDYLGREPNYRGWVLLNGRHPAVMFEGPRGPVAVAWSAAPGIGEELAYRVPVTVVDPLSGRVSASFTPRLTRTPLILSGLPAALTTEAARNRGTPVGWNPRFGNASELFIDHEQGRTSGGLHTLAEASVADAVRTYGGSARSGSVPGGNFFVLHPSFLNNTSVPLEITVVVRRLSPTVAAGFNLKYESVTATGFKTAGGWYTVPSAPGWHAKTWRIVDPRMVGQWGYHFVLDSDGRHDQYALHSIRVRKLGRVPAQP